MLRQKKHLNSIKVSHEKHTAGSISEKMSVPEIVSISMTQHIGAPCRPLVSRGDYVKVGQPVGDSDAFISAPIHSSVSGIVKDITTMRAVTGGEDQMLIVEADGEQTVWEGAVPPAVKSREDFIDAVHKSGAVGLGGAAFPTYVKLSPKNPEEVDTLIVNGAECEPFITSDHRLMLEDTQSVIDGAAEIMKYLDLKKTYIGVEENKPDAVEALRKAINESGYSSDMEVKVLRARYPQGAERVMIYEIMGKVLRAGMLPADVGVILSNVTTVSFIGNYMKTGIPLVEKRITVDGNAVKVPKNIIVPIGSRIADVIENCGGYSAEPRKILMGGPMMGRAVYSDAFPVIKNNNAILVFDGKQAFIPEETACIRCGRCYSACPFELMPVAIAEAYDRKDADRLEALKVAECMECGSCSYICPARRPLSFINKMSKGFLKEAAGK